MPPKSFDRVDEIHRFFMNPALCHAGSTIHKILSTLTKVIGDWGGGGGGTLPEVKSSNPAIPQKNLERAPIFNYQDHDKWSPSMLKVFMK